MIETSLPTAAWFAKHVMGKKALWLAAFHGKYGRAWNPPANLADAMQMLEATGQNWWLSRDTEEREVFQYRCELAQRCYEYAARPEHAICRAVEAWVLAQKETA